MIFRMGELAHFTFVTHIVYAKSRPDTTPKWAWSGSHGPFLILVYPVLSLEWMKLYTSNLVCKLLLW